MKKVFTMSGLFLAMMMLLISMDLEAKKPFEGTITYKITYPDMDLDPQTASMLPKVAIVKVKDEWIKSSIIMGQGSQASMYNTETHTAYNLLDMMGQKFVIKSTEEEIKEELESFQTSVEKTDETKEIAGYKAQKAIVTVKDKTEKEYELTVWYTDEIEISKMNMMNPMFKDIEGTMLQYEIRTGQGNMMFTATNIDKGSVSKSEFEIADDYKEVTEEELRSMFGGGM